VPYTGRGTLLLSLPGLLSAYSTCALLLRVPGVTARTRYVYALKHTTAGGNDVWLGVLTLLQQLSGSYCNACCGERLC
jgi:hypothetical protein